MLPWQRYIRQLNYQKAKVCVVNLLAGIFGDRGSRVLKKKVNETQISKTVFSIHLNACIHNNSDSNSNICIIFKEHSSGYNTSQCDFTTL